MSGFEAIGWLAVGEADEATGDSISASTIASAEAFGTASVIENGNVNLDYLNQGIASAEAFGTAWLQADNIIGLIGDIASEEAFGAWYIGEVKTYLPVSKPTPTPARRLG